MNETKKIMKTNHPILIAFLIAFAAEAPADLVQHLDAGDTANFQWHGNATRSLLYHTTQLDGSESHPCLGRAARQAQGRDGCPQPSGWVSVAQCQTLSAAPARSRVVKLLQHHFVSSPITE